MKNKLGLAFLLSFLSAGSPAAIAEGAIAVHDAWARATAPVATSGAVFMTVRGGRIDDQLVAAESAVARTVEVHTHSEVDGMMRMHPVPEVAIPAQTDVAFKPGGLHVMLIGLNSPLVAGERFSVTLRFHRGGALTVPVEVRAATARAPTPQGETHRH